MEQSQALPISFEEILQLLGAKEVDIYLLRRKNLELKQENVSLHTKIKELEKVNGAHS